MVLKYKNQNGKCYTLAELAKKFPREWEYVIKTESKFWGKMCLTDLLAEASDSFEEILCNLEYYIEPIGSLGNDDLNVLLAPLWNDFGFSIMYEDKY